MGNPRKGRSDQLHHQNVELTAALNLAGIELVYSSGVWILGTVVLLTVSYSPFPHDGHGGGSAVGPTYARSLQDVRRKAGLSNMYRRRITDALTRNQEPRSGARQRILDNAYELFSRRGIRAVGVEEVISRAAVAKATLYRHFPSKVDLVLAFLEERELRWSRQFVEARARERGAGAEERLLAIFDVFDDWSQQADYEGCSFINVLLETGDREHPIGRASAGYLENIRTFVRTLAEEAGLRDPEAFALSWHLLMKGAIVQAAEGDGKAAQRAKTIARLVLDEHRLTAP